MSCCAVFHIPPHLFLCRSPPTLAQASQFFTQPTSIMLNHHLSACTCFFAFFVHHIRQTGVARCFSSYYLYHYKSKKRRSNAVFLALRALLFGLFKPHYKPDLLIDPLRVQFSNMYTQNHRPMSPFSAYMLRSGIMRRQYVWRKWQCSICVHPLTPPLLMCSQSLKLSYLLCSPVLAWW